MQIKNWKISSALTLLILLSAFRSPEVGDLIELENLVNARQSARFRKTDQNRAYVLGVGTKAQVTEIQYFAKTQNYGLKIKLINAAGVREEQSSSLWVYYNVKKPSLKLYSLAGDENALRDTLKDWSSSPQVQALEVQKPQEATAAVVTAETPALPAVNFDSSTPQTLIPEENNQEPAKEVVATLARIEHVTGQVKKDPVPCLECTQRQAQYDSCNSQNDYLEKQIDRLQGQDYLRQLLSTSEQTLSASCVRESMKFTSGPFAKCVVGSTLGQTTAAKACTSQKLVKLVDQSLNLSMKCFAKYLNSNAQNPEVFKQTSRSVIALINLESGFHLNARSTTGASGLGQITAGASKAILKNQWAPMRSFANQSAQRECKDLSKIYPAAPSNINSSGCDNRMNLDSGGPLANMLYTIGHMKLVRTEVELTLNRKLKELGIRLSAVQNEKLISSLVTWGHNTGSYGITRPLLSLLSSTTGQEALKNENIDSFLSLMKGEVAGFHRNYLRRRSAGGSSENRIKEASQFFDHVQNKMKKLEQRVGRKCEI